MHGRVTGMVTGSDYAYVADNYVGFSIVDIRDTLSMTISHPFR